MGILSNLRRGSAVAQEERRSSIVVFTQMYDEQLQSADLDDKQRMAVQSEKNSFENMTDKEKMKWIEFKNRGGFKDQGAAGSYAGGKCC